MNQNHFGPNSPCPLKCSKLVTYFHCANRTRSPSHAYLPVNKVSKLFVDHFFIVRSISPSWLLADSFFCWFRLLSSAFLMWFSWMPNSVLRVRQNRYRVSSIWASLNGPFINEHFSLAKCRVLRRVSISLYIVVLYISLCCSSCRSLYHHMHHSIESIDASSRSLIGLCRCSSKFMRIQQLWFISIDMSSMIHDLLDSLIKIGVTVWSS